MNSPQTFGKMKKIALITTIGIGLLIFLIHSHYTTNFDVVFGLAAPSPADAPKIKQNSGSFFEIEYKIAPDSFASFQQSATNSGYAPWQKNDVSEYFYGTFQGYKEFKHRIWFTEKTHHNSRTSKCMLFYEPETSKFVGLAFYN